MMQLNLKKKIATFTTIFILLIIASLLTNMWGLQKIHFAKEEAEIAHRMYDSFQELRILWEMSLMGPHDYIIHKGQHEIEIFEQDYKRLLDKEIALVNLIVKNEMKRSMGFNIILKETGDNFLLLEQELDEYKGKASDIFNLDLPGQMHKAGFYMEEMDVLVREVEDNLAEMGLLMKELSNQAMDSIHAIHLRVLIFLFIFGIIAILAGIVLGRLLSKSITVPVDYLVQAARKIKDGDLTARAKVKTKDEIGELTESFNEMVNKLVDVQEDISNILLGSGDAMRVIDKNFTILRNNKQMEKFLSMASTEIKNKKCYEIYHCEVCHTESCYLKRILGGEERIESEIISKMLDGRQVPVEIIITPYKKKGQIAGIIESIRDITDRRKAQGELSDSQKKLKTIFDTVQTGIFVIDAESQKIMEANQVAVDLVDVPKGEMLGAVCHKFVCSGEKGHCPINDLGQSVDNPNGCS